MVPRLARVAETTVKLLQPGDSWLYVGVSCKSLASQVHLKRFRQKETIRFENGPVGIIARTLSAVGGVKIPVDSMGVSDFCLFGPPLKKKKHFVCN